MKSKSNGGSSKGNGRSSKDRGLEPFRERPKGTALTTDQGVRGPPHRRLAQGRPARADAARGLPPPREDHALRPRAHPRARRARARRGAPTATSRSTSRWPTSPGPSFLHDPALRTPVFVRFSTVAGSRGSADTVRDVRGFATKFYTDEGNFDLVGNNIPVFFIQDGIKFPDFVHAVKPEPHNEMPAGGLGARHVLGLRLARARDDAHGHVGHVGPRAPAQLPDDGGLRRPHLPARQRRAARRTLVKFHWKPLLGAHSLVWDEAQKIAGQGPRLPPPRPVGGDRGRRTSPSTSSACRSSPRRTSSTFDFDLLDATKLMPEELVPVRRVGKLTLNRNPDNFFAETEQVAFCVGNVVPGIDFTNDPLLQARLFSYLDTQLIAARRAELRRDPDQPAGRARCTTTSRTAITQHDDQHGAGPLPPEHARRRLPGLASADAGGLRPLTGAGRGPQDPRAQRELRRPLQPGHAVLEQPVASRSSSTSSRRAGSSSARSSARRSASASSTCLDASTASWPRRWRAPSASRRRAATRTARPRGRRPPSAWPTPSRRSKDA